MISIVITDENLIQDSPNYHHRFTFYDKNADVELTDLVEIHLLELPKLPRNTDGTLLYDWASFIAAETEEELIMVAERNEQVGKAVTILRELSGDERARELYFLRELARMDENSRTRGAIKKREIEIAKKLLTRGRDIDEIVDDTGLTREEVEKLRNAM